MSTHRLDVEATVEVTVNDPVVIARVVENHDNWRGTFYSLYTEDDVLNHLAFNCLANQVDRVNRLDGWADLDDDAATMRLDRSTVDVAYRMDVS